MLPRRTKTWLRGSCKYRGAWKDGFAREFNIYEKGMYPYSLFPIPYSQNNGTGLFGSFVLPLTSAWEEVLNSMFIRLYLQSISTLPGCRQIFLFSQLRERHLMGKSQEGVRFNLSHCQSDRAVSSRILTSFFPSVFWRLVRPILSGGEKGT